MIGLVVTGHGHFADGIHTSAQMIAVIAGTNLPMIVTAVTMLDMEDDPRRSITAFCGGLAVCTQQKTGADVPKGVRSRVVQSGSGFAVAAADQDLALDILLDVLAADGAVLLRVEGLGVLGEVFLQALAEGDA